MSSTRSHMGPEGQPCKEESGPLGHVVSARFPPLPACPTGQLPVSIVPPSQLISAKPSPKSLREAERARWKNFSGTIGSAVLCFG